MECFLCDARIRKTLLRLWNFVYCWFYVSIYNVLIYCIIITNILIIQLVYISNIDAITHLQILISKHKKIPKLINNPNFHFHNLLQNKFTAIKQIQFSLLSLWRILIQSMQNVDIIAVVIMFWMIRSLQ